MNVVTVSGRRPSTTSRPARRSAAFALLLLGCASAPLLAGFGSNNTCVANRPGGNNCTSNDLTFVLIGLGVQSNGCINEDDMITIELGAQIRNGTAQTRYDVGIFIDRDNVSAYSGINCAVETLHPLGAIGNFNCPPLNLNDYPNGGGPFLNTDGDACGDLQNESGTGCDVNPPDGFYDDTFIRLPPLTFACEAGVTGDGFLKLASCLTWGNNNDQVGSIVGTGAAAKTCDSENDVHAGTNAKCRCNDSQATNVPLPNLRLNCDSFHQSRTLNNGETASFDIAYTNAIPGACTPGGASSDPYGRFRCGTAGFVRFVVDYVDELSDPDVNADDHGNFFVNGGVDPILACPSTVALTGNTAVVCNDTANGRLVFAPRDTQAPNSWTVVSPFAGTQTLTFQYTKTDIFTGTLTFTSNIYWDDLVDNDPANGVISATEAVTIGGSTSVQQCSNCTCTSTPAATPVTLASFRSQPDGREVRFDWSTESEVGNVGFNLFAVVDGRRIPLNQELVPAHFADALEPQSYTAWFPVPDGVESYFVEDVDLRGKTKRHGPFAPGKVYGTTVAPQRIDWGAVRHDAGLGASESGRATERPRGRSAGRSATRTTEMAASAPAGPIDLHVDQTGLYRVTHAQLLAAGLDLSAASSSQLGLTVGGVAVPIHVQAGAKFGPGSWFEFWGEALDTLYTETNVYRLTTGVKKPARAAVSSALPSGGAAASYLEPRRFERDLGYAYWSSGPDPFFDTQMLVFGGPNQWNLPFTVDALAAGAASLHAEYFGATSFAAVTPDHRIEFLVNGTSVGVSSFDGATYHAFDATIPPGLLVEGANTLTLRLPGNTGAPFDMSSLDHFVVTYPRAFAAQAGRLDFAGQSGRYEVTGLPSSDVVAYRRDGAGLTRLAGVSVAADGGGFRAVVPGSSSASSYSVASASALLAPAAILPARPPADLKSGAASYLVISNAAFLDGLGALVSARQANGFSVKVVDVEDVYAQFSHGVFDARAIRDYVGYAYKSLGTTHVLLVGGDTYDYRDFLGLAPVSFVPSLYRATHEVVSFAPSDASYADVDGDGVQDLAIGRFPVRTQQELADIVEKTLQYEGRSYTGVGAVAADANDPAASEPFTSVADEFSADLGSTGWQVDEISLGALGLATARSRLFADLAAGSSLTAFVGHSGQVSWGSPALPVNQRLFSVNDVPNLQNAGLPTVVVQFGCWNTYYNHPQIESLGNRLVLQGERGAAAAMGTATLTQDSNNNRFGRLLAPLLATQGVTIGEAIWQAKQAMVAAAPGVDLSDILFGWTLLGDPALQATP